MTGQRPESLLLRRFSGEPRPEKRDSVRVKVSAGGVVLLLAAMFLCVAQPPTSANRLLYQSIFPFLSEPSLR